MIDARGPRRCAARRTATGSGRRSSGTTAARWTTTADEHQEVDAGADLPGRCRSLIDHRLQTEQLHVHRHRVRIARGDREVTRVLQSHETGLRRALGDRTHIAERAAPAAVADVMQLEDHAARIGDEQIAGAPVGLTAFVLSPRANERLLRSWLVRASFVGTRRGRRDAVCGKRLHRAIDREVLHAEAEGADARTLACARLPQRQESRTVADAEQHRRTLPRLDRHTEESLIELERSLDVADCQRDLAQSVDTEGRLRRPLSEQTRSSGQDGKRCEETAAGDCHHAGNSTCDVTEETEDTEDTEGSTHGGNGDNGGNTITKKDLRSHRFLRVIDPPFPPCDSVTASA